MAESPPRPSWLAVLCCACGNGLANEAGNLSSFTAFSQEVIRFVFIEVEGARLVLHAIDATGREFDQAVIGRAVH